MHSSAPLILLRENGYKALTAPSGSDDLRIVMAEISGKIVRVGAGDFHVTVSFANRNDAIGELGRNFNQMVHQLRQNREEVERLHRAQMSRADQLATIGELAAGVTHEIRNPLAGIAGVIEIVGRDLPATSPARAVVKDVRLEIAQINHVLTEFLQTASPRLPEIWPGDLNITVERAVVLAGRQVASTPIRIELLKDPNLPAVEHDRGQIHQLFLNLLLNAVHALEGVGSIRVKISLLNGEATIAVADTGCGIAPEHLPNIFRPFYTTKGNGTGLGLSTARQIAEEHHGRIEVASEVGKGTRFLVVLPLRQTSTASC
jgi:signal transduction histidine kinase